MSVSLPIVLSISLFIQVCLYICLCVGYFHCLPVCIFTSCLFFYLSFPYQIILWLNFSPVFPIDIIDIDCAESERDVNNDKNEEKNHDIKDHVGHADDDWTGLAPHETHLAKK